MKNVIKLLRIIALVIIIGFSMTACEGPMGPAGPAGKNGIDGINGIDGKDGKDGVDGEKGDKGDPGPQGRPNEIPIPAVPENDMAIIPVSRSSDAWWLERHNNKKNVMNNQKIIFIGDSITQFWETDGANAWNALNQEYNNKITNLGYSGDRTQHVIWRLENGEFPVGINPEYVVIMIGVNNVYDERQDPVSTAAGIGKIVKLINAKASYSKIILMSILPCGTGNDDKNTERNNIVNEIIEKYDGHINIKYLDIRQYYLNADGSLKDELFTDGLHLSLSGYNLWKEKIMEKINEIEAANFT